MDLLPLLLLVLGLCSPLALGNDVKLAPPEDLDGSGDDEDFSGSGMEREYGEDLTTVASPMVTTVSTAQKPDLAVEEEENATEPTQMIKVSDLPDEIVVFKPTTEQATSLEPTTQQASTVASVNDVKQHHQHHTTMPVTSIPAKIDVIEETTTGLSEVEKPFVGPEDATRTPDEGDVDDLVGVTPTPEGSVKHADHPETTSGLTSTSSAHETDVEDADEIPLFVDSVEKTTVSDNADHDTTSAVPLDGSDTLIETTEKPEYVEPEDKDLQGEATTTPPSEDKHHDHHHKHHHHHPTTSGATQSTEQNRVHTQEPKGRRINVPPAEATTVVPDEGPVGTTVQYIHVSPTQDDDTPDSTEDESGDGPIGDDIFFEKATVPVENRMVPVPDDGSSGASHGIMERKELLAGIIAGGIAGLVFAASLVAFVFYRMKKKDEGSYSLEEPKQSNGGYQKPREQREFYA